MSEQLSAAPAAMLPAPEPMPMMLEAFIDEHGTVKILSATPADAEPAPRPSERLLLSAPGGSPERKHARLRVLEQRERELAKAGDQANALAVVREQIAEVRQELAALESN